MNVAITPLEHRVALDTQGAAAIRKAIVDGALRPGALVNETELGQTLGISRSTARTALKLLELEGLVSQQHYKGWRIFTPTADDALNLYELRGALEGVAAAQVARAARAEGLMRMTRDYEAMQAAAGRQDMGAMSDADHAFHTGLIVESANPRLADQYLQVQQHIKIYVATANRIRGRFRDIVHDHDGIRDAILAGDAPAAEAAAREHSRVAGEMIATVIGGRHDSA